MPKKKSTRKQLEVVIYNLLEGLRIVSGLVYPVMPETAFKIQKHLGMDPEKPFFHFDQLKMWKLLPSGRELPKSITLFPRVDLKKDTLSSIEDTDTKPHSLDIKSEITFEEFKRVDLRVATVVHAEMVPRAKKLVKLEVDLGDKRTVVAGISESYTPEELVGKQVIIVANLAPAKIMGIQSNGMLLAAVDKQEIALATLDKSMKPGVPLR